MSNTAPTPLISNLAGGNYTVTVTDSKNCQEFKLSTVPAITSPNLKCNIVVTKQMSGNNTNDAEARADGSLGLAPYAYLWSTGATTQTVTGLKAQQYTVTITDANGCKTNCSVDVLNNLCINITNPGAICCSQTFCPPNTSTLQPILETSPASGGSAANIEYLWMYSTIASAFNSSNDWITIPNATGKDLPVNMFPTITGKTWIIRCVRRMFCPDYRESNIVLISPAAEANWDGLTTTCANQIVQFVAVDNGPTATYRWTFTGANITASVSRIPQVIFTSTGTKQVTLEVTANGCTQTKTANVTVTNCLGAYGGFVGFNANPVREKEVMLDWATTDEQKPSNYLIEKSNDGINYTTIGSVASQNKANNLYRFADVEPKMGRSFYRIHQISLDNIDVKTTDAKKILMGLSGQSVLTYPNPAQSSVFVEVLDADNAEGTIEVYNHIGILVRTQKFTSNQMRYEINTDNLSSGTYILKIRRSDGDVKSVKISKL